jgi:hypothetical protein
VSSDPAQAGSIPVRLRYQWLYVLTSPVDQPLDLGRGDAGEVGKSRCRQPKHAAVILGAV